MRSWNRSQLLRGLVLEATHLERRRRSEKTLMLGSIQLVIHQKTDSLLQYGQCKFTPIRKHKQATTIAVVAKVTELHQPVHRGSEMHERLDSDPVHFA